MANQLNRLLTGLYAGINQVAQGVYQHQDNVESNKLYNTAMQGLQELLNKYSTPEQPEVKSGEVPLYQRNNVINPAEPTATGESTPYQKLDSKLIDENTIQVKKQPVSMQDLYGKLQTAQNDLLNYGEIGKQRAGLLGNYFSQMLKMQPEQKILETKDGLYTYDLNNPTGTLKLIQPFEKKPEKKVYSVGDYGKMNINDVESLSADEFKKGFSSFNEDVIQQIFQKYPEIYKQYQDKYNEGDFAKTTGRSGYRSRGRGTTGKMSLEEQAQLKNLELVAKDEVPEEEVQALADAYGISIGELKQQAEDYYKGNKSGKEVTGGLIEEKDRNKRQNQIGNDLVAFQNDIEQNIRAIKDDNGKIIQPNYEISAVDWAKELKDAGFLDNIDEDDFRTISNWFRSKTGRKLKDYL